MKTSPRRREQSGIALFLATTSLLFIVPMLGLVVDTGFLYGAKTQLQGSVDGAALAAGRALRLGQTTDSQAANAKQNAVTWFYANFPPNTWGTTDTYMSTNDTYVKVYDDALNPNLRHVDVQATTTVPTYFMKWFGTNSTTISAMGYATRRDVVGMLVLDRSGSMGGSCTNLKTAAKQFTGQFAAGRDRLGLVSFSDGVAIQSAPVTTFQTALGYSNALGSSTGAIDAITCNGGTNTASAISLAYAELYKLKLPGAFNLMLVETDGKPTAASFNWWDGAGFGIASGSNCQDSAGLTKAGGGWTFGSPAPGLPTQPATTRVWGSTSPNLPIPSFVGVDAQHPGYAADVLPGAIGTLYADSSNGLRYTLWNVMHSAPTLQQIKMNAPGCQFNNTEVQNYNDFAWIPQTDVFGSSIKFTPDNYKTVTTGTNGRYIMTGADTTSLNNIEINLADNAAYRARTSTKFCSSTTCTATGNELKATVYTIGFTSSVDHTLLRRMANDPNSDQYNGLTPAYTETCANTPGCVNYSNQPVGTYVYAPNTTTLNQAFMTISSQVLRLSN